MKPQPLTLLCLALLAFALSACKKSSNPKPAAANTISLTFKGTVYTTSDIVASMRHDTLEMVANFSSGIATTMYIVNPAAGPSYDISSGQADAVLLGNSLGEYVGEEGSVKVTALTGNTVAGTFSYTGADQEGSGNQTISNGSFSTSYKTL